MSCRDGRLLLVLFGGVCGLLAPLRAQEKNQPTSARIQTRYYDFKEAGKKMEYALFVPSRYDPATRTPLVVALHGLLATPQMMMRYPKLTDEAEKYGFIVVAPMGYNTRGWYGARPLVKPTKGDPENLAELSEKDVLNVLAIVKKEFNIDPQRLYLMGHSMGGGGTWHFAIKYPDLWAAIAPIAPASVRPATDVAKIKHIPVLLIQGDQDNLVPVAGVRRWAEEMKRLNMTFEYVEVAGGGHVDVAFQNIPRIFAFFDRHRKK
ncbi:MAG: alpha/beta hydrolase-fold protein [Gemmataceae bacterium]|nr:alpha/beta hydrolase-fold protein [Gemmataceae bacterium]